MSVEMQDAVNYTPIQRMRHSASHVLAEAVLEVFPDAKLAIGPAIEDGFYYDFDLPRSLTPDDLPDLEQRMQRIIAGKYPFIHDTWPREKALHYFQEKDQPYKVELIENLPDQEVGMERQDTFLDLCRGQHVENTGQIGPFKLMRVAGAYWRGDEHRPMLQRIYGTAWFTQEELDQYLWRLEEAKKRDHRTLGKALDLFSTSEAVGPGLILWHPRGATIRFLAERFSQEAHLYNGYEWVYTPHIGRAGLWETSGHLGFYRDSMYAPMDIEGEDYYVKPMNCPFHILIYRSSMRSYRDLPQRLFEFGSVYRYEKSGVVHGLTRVRGMTQDDAHIFCTKEQMIEELQRTLAFVLDLLRDYGLDDFYLELSTRNPEKSIGSDEDWERATDALREAAEASGLELVLDPGGAAFYAPKISVQVKDAIGRTWQMSTIQVDLMEPELFGLEYTANDGSRQQPVMIHRALFGSIERFFGVVTEHYAGAFPAWLAPVQVVAIPVTGEQVAATEEVAAQLRSHGVRVEVDAGDDRMQKKIRTHTLAKVPFMLLAGARDVEAGAVSFRFRDGTQRNGVPVAEATAAIVDWIASRNNTSPTADL